MIGDTKHLFMGLLAIYMTLEKYLFTSSAYFLIELIIFYVVMCELFVYLGALSDISFANVFSHSVACLFTLLIASFTVQKLFGLVPSHLFISAFIPLSEETYPKKYC